MNIDLVKLAKHELTINEYLTLVMLDKIDNGIDFPFTSTEKTINSLKDSEYLRIDNTSRIFLTEKAKKIINPEEDKIDFDEIFFLYPSRTPSGRILRTKNKEVRGSFTKEYLTLKKKYLGRVKSAALHNEVISATKAMKLDKKNRGAEEYMRNLETYINRQEWEQYVGEEVKDSSSNNNWERL